MSLETLPGKFAEYQNAPGQTPELVGVGERNAARNPDVLRGILLKQVPHHPAESAQKKPEQDWPGGHQFSHHAMQPSVADHRQGANRRQFTESEHSDERERIHSADVSFP